MTGFKSNENSPLRKLFLVIIMMSFVIGVVAPSANSHAAEEPPSIKVPGKLPQPRSEALFLCQRPFQYRGRTLNCDSFHQTDGENLREIIQDVPDAINELNTYQETRRSLRKLAFIQSAGIVAAIVGNIMGAFPLTQNGALRTGAGLFIGGITVAGGSFIYGLTVSRTNEAHLGKAVDLYNLAHPEDPIALQFSAGISF